MFSAHDVGAVHRDSSESDLRRVYGEDRVHDHLVQVGEGFVCRGTKIAFPDGESLAVTWVDAGDRTKIASVTLLGTRWRTAEGLVLGSSLQDLARMNGRPFMLSGFGWDYGGTVGSWNGGYLTYLNADSAAGVVVRLAPNRAAYELVEPNALSEVMGDAAYVSSDHPVLQTLAPLVSQIFVRFGPEDCQSFIPE